MKEIVIVSAVRTPIGNFGGSLKEFSAAELGEFAAGEAIRRAGLTPDQIDEGIFGSARQAGLGPNLARQITWRCGVPEDKTAYTINKACGSGMKAVTLAAQSIQTGENDIVLAGGVEAMSQIPYLLMQARWGYRLGDGTLVDANYRDGYNCPLCEMVMGETVDRMAEEYKITRQMQDEFAAESHRRAVAAREAGAFADEIVPVSVPQRKKDPLIVDTDERPRGDSTPENLAKLRPVFRPADEGGTITAANASGITDGAAALVLMSSEKASQLGIEPLAVLAGHAAAGVAPARMGIAPVPATQKLLQNTGTHLEDVDLIELNEAFSAQAIMVDQDMGWDPEKRNVHGGAVSLGHPTGCTGARIMVTLVHAMRQRAAHTGVATLCISGGTRNECPSKAMTNHSYPNGNIFYRRITHDHPVISHGEGLYLYDTDGKCYLDASGGAIVTNIGHGVREIADAIAEQINRVAMVHPTQFTSQPLEDYAAALAEICPLPDPRFYFLSSGSEAVETALKLARQIQIERREAGRHIIISRWLSYHGGTLGALSVTGKVKVRQHYQPMLHDVPHIPPVYCYRCPFDHSYPACGLRCACALEDEIRRTGPENVAAFIAEPFSGATLGAIIPPNGYWQRIREICDQYGVLLIADEVMTGMGRTGKWFAVEHLGVTPDIMTIAKGTSAGYLPFSAAAVRGEHVELIVRNGHDFVHGGTFSHHPVAAAGALATLKYLQKHDLVTAVARKGEILGAKLRQALGHLDIVGDIRGIGMMWGIEFVQDQATRSPFPPGLSVVQKIGDEAFRRGLVVYPITGCVDGISGDHLMLGPSFIIEETHMDELCVKLQAAIETVAQTLSA